MLDQDYHAHPALSATKIKAMATGTSRRYWAKHEDPARKPFLPTEPMRQGSLVDCLITEPDSFGLRYVEQPACAPKRPTSAQLNAKKPAPATVEAIEFWRDFDDQAQGREPITKAWLDNAWRIVETLHLDPLIGPLLELPRISQEPHFWVDAEHQAPCRYKPDLENEYLIDLKKGASATPRTFAAQAYKLGYDIQIAHYSLGYEDRNGRPPEKMGFIVYEWEWPHDCALIWADDDYLAMGLDRRRDAIERILECRESGIWPSHGEVTISPPRYANLTAADDDTELSDLGLEGL